MDLKIKKADADQHLVWAEVYVPGFPDADGDTMTAPEIEGMAYKFMRERKTDAIDLQHNNQKIAGAHLVESFIARKGDPDFPVPGSWVVGVYVPDPVWGMVKKGEINGFSMEALVTRRPDVIEIEIPPVISGFVTKADDGHDHEFFISYDEQGNFLGGKTSKADDGHYHEIKRGTVTEVADGHNHRFSYVEKLLQ